MTPFSLLLAGSTRTLVVSLNFVRLHEANVREHKTAGNRSEVKRHRGQGDGEHKSYTLATQQLQTKPALLKHGARAARALNVCNSSNDKKEQQ